MHEHIDLCNNIIINIKSRSASRVDARGSTRTPQRRTGRRRGVSLPPKTLVPRAHIPPDEEEQGRYGFSTIVKLRCQFALNLTTSMQSKRHACRGALPGP